MCLSREKLGDSSWELSPKTVEFRRPISYLLATIFHLDDVRKRPLRAAEVPNAGNDQESGPAD